MNHHALHVLAALPLLGCSSISRTCSTPVHPENADTEDYSCDHFLCIADSIDVHVTSEAPLPCRDTGCSDQAADNYIGYSEETEEMYVDFGFESPGVAPSDEDMTAAFVYFTLQRVTIASGPQSGLDVFARTVRWDADRPFDSVSVENGRLVASGTAEVTEARYDHDDLGEDFCLVGDIQVPCYCEYQNLNTVLNVTVDLPFTYPD